MVMNKRILHACCLAALLASGGLAAEDKEAEKAAVSPAAGDTPIATINGSPIPLDLFRLFYTERLRQGNAQNTPEFQNQAFNEFVNIVVTAQDAERKGLDKQDQVGYALAVQRLQLLSRLALQDAAQNIKPSEEELKKAYEERYGKEKRTEYKARHILVKTEDEAKKVIAKLKGGAKFAELANEESLAAGKNGGDLGWFDAAQMVQPFTQAVAAMKPGGYSQKPVQTQFGWHVILLEETRQADPPALDSVKDELIAGMAREKLGAYVSDLRGKADLKLNSELIKSSEPAAAEPAKAPEKAPDKAPDKAADKAPSKSK